MSELTGHTPPSSRSPRAAASIVDNDSGSWDLSLDEQEHDPLVGTVLSNTYKIVRILGEGGMGRVYEAQHTRIASKRFALKALHPEFARRKEVLVRFQREVEAAASIESPHVVGVFDVDQTEDGQPYLVSELLQGKELGDYLQERGRINVGFAVRIARQICTALGAAHERGIIHRDMKPENVFLSGDVHEPVVKVLDFGISRLEGQAGNTLTKTGIVMGTPSYMAPEQAKGLRVDQRVDVYAVGAILYQCVTGKIPFDRSDATATLAAVLTEEPERPRAIAPDIPEHFEMIIQRAMAREVEDRYQNMAELDAALAPYDEREMLLSAPDTTASFGVMRAPQGSLVEATGAAREVSDARPQLLLFAALGIGMLLAVLATAISGGLRLFREPLATLSGTEAMVVALVLVAALATPLTLALRNLFRTTWSNTAKVLETVRTLREPLIAVLAIWGAGAMVIRTLETFVARTPVGVAWPFWDLLLPLVAAGAGVVTFVARKNGLIKRVGATVLMSSAAATIIAVIAVAALVRSPVELPVVEDDARPRARSQPRASSEKSGAPAEPSATPPPAPAKGEPEDAPKPTPKAPPADLPKFDSPMKAWLAMGDALNKGHIQKSIDALEVFVTMDPNGPKDKNVRDLVERLAVQACVDKQSPHCLRLMDLIKDRLGEGGVDVLFELMVNRGGTGANWHAVQLLDDEKLRDRGTPAFRVAYELRDASSCAKVQSLLARAALEGDHRASRELEIITGPKRQCQARGCCLQQGDEQVKAAKEAIKARLATR
jgi:serine/threonine-protein kinase